jgi:hypothetical protein
LLTAAAAVLALADSSAAVLDALDHHQRFQVAAYHVQDHLQVRIEPAFDAGGAGGGAAPFCLLLLTTFFAAATMARLSTGANDRRVPVLFLISPPAPPTSMTVSTVYDHAARQDGEVDDKVGWRAAGA